MTRSEYEERVARMRSLGEVTETDFMAVPHRAPYRFARLHLSPDESEWRDVLCAAVALAIEINGYVTVQTGGARFRKEAPCEIDMHLARDLEADELPAPESLSGDLRGAP